MRKFKLIIAITEPEDFADKVSPDGHLSAQEALRSEAEAWLGELGAEVLGMEEVREEGREVKEG